MHETDVLPRQVAALEALATAISQQAWILDAEGREAVDAVVKSSTKLAQIVRLQLAEPDIAKA